jgi:hypothetical protein
VEELEKVDVLLKQNEAILNRIEVLEKAKQATDKDKEEEEMASKLFKRMVKLFKDAGFLTKSETVEALKSEGFLTKGDVASLGPHSIAEKPRHSNTPQEVIQGQDKDKEKEEYPEFKSEDEDKKVCEKQDEDKKDEEEEKKAVDEKDEEEDEEKKSLKKENAELKKTLDQLRASIPGLVNTEVQKEMKKMGFTSVSATPISSISPEETVVVKGKAVKQTVDELTKLSYSDLAQLRSKVERGEVTVD